MESDPNNTFTATALGVFVGGLALLFVVFAWPVLLTLALIALAAFLLFAFVAQMRTSKRFRQWVLGIVLAAGVAWLVLIVTAQTT